MKKFKAILALVLVACLFVTLFAACAKSEETPNTNTNTGTNTENKEPAKDDDKAPADDKQDEPAGDEGTDAPPAEDDKNDLIDWDADPTVLQFWFYCNSQWKDEANVTDPVLEKINAILREKINVEIEWTLLLPADYRDKVGLAIGGGETIDVMGTMPLGRISNWYAQGMLTEVTDLLPTYAPEALELCEGLTGGYTYDGGLYGLPTLRNLPSQSFIYYSTEALEKVGMVEKFHEMKSFDDFEEVLEALTALVPEGMWPIGSDFNGLGTPSMLNSRNFSELMNVEAIGDTTGTIFVEDGVVKMVQADDRYEASVIMRKEWYDKGYVWPDSLYNTQNAKDDLMKQKVLAGQINGSEYGVEAIKEGLLGYGLEVMGIGTPVIGPATAATWGICIPVTAEEPEAACMFINELYTNAELMNLFVHGIEGADHTVVGGEVVYSENPHYSNGQHVIGNQLLTWPLAGQGADFNDVIRELNANAELSKYMGFSLNTGDLELYISNLNAVKDQFNQTILSGGYTEALYQEYVAKLEDADWAGYAAAVQAQLDAFVAANK